MRLQRSKRRTAEAGESPPSLGRKRVGVYLCEDEITHADATVEKPPGIFPVSNDCGGTRWTKHYWGKIKANLDIRARHRATQKKKKAKGNQMWSEQRKPSDRQGAKMQTSLWSPPIFFFLPRAPAAAGCSRKILPVCFAEKPRRSEPQHTPKQRASCLSIQWIPHSTARLNCIPSSSRKAPRPQ